MKKHLLILFVISISCTAQKSANVASAKEEITKIVNAWHKAAADAKFDDYFGLMTSDAVFIGTDPTENWQNSEFKKYSKPYFDKGKAWSFTAVERNIYLSNDQNMAWFDELLNTQMKICRGSGVLRKENGKWKIAHYVLSMTIPNDNTDEVVKIKSNFDDAILKKLAN